MLKKIKNDETGSVKTEDGIRFIEFKKNKMRVWDIQTKTDKPTKRKTKIKEKPVVMTIGHSTHTIEEFIQILESHGVNCIADVRTIPRSRHNPQFNKDSLPLSLKEAGIKYIHIPELGGLRHTTKDSPNTGWRNASFRGYADYMQTQPFEKALDKLIKLIKKKHVALMCAEAVPWRCHRSLIADALLVRGIASEHIMSRTSRQVHSLTPFAKVRGTRITYPAEEANQTMDKKGTKNISVKSTKLRKESK